MLSPKISLFDGSVSKIYISVGCITQYIFVWWRFYIRNPWLGGCVTQDICLMEVKHEISLSDGSVTYDIFVR